MNNTLPDDKFDKQQKLIEIMNESETDNEDTSDSVYDDVMRTMCERHIVYLIPLINKYLNTHYTLDADIQLLNNEHHKVISEKMDLKATDAFFQVTENTESHIYHLECQSTADSSMIIRIVEYDFMIALDEMSRNISNNKYHSTLQLPETMVVYLRHGSRMPDEFHVDIEYKDQKIEYKAPIIKAKSISLKEMCEEQLYFFLPFYLMQYEDQIKSGTEPEIEFVLERIQELKNTIQTLIEAEKINEYYGEQLLIYARRIVAKIANDSKNKEAKERLVESMSGQIIITKLDKAFDAGEAQGISIGENGILTLIQKLFASGRGDEVQKVSEDELYRQQLMKEFGLSHDSDQ